eukprot:5961268-Amphidinium_carterae.1
MANTSQSWPGVANPPKRRTIYSMHAVIMQATLELRALFSLYRHTGPSFKRMLVETLAAGVNANMPVTIQANIVGLVFNNTFMRPNHKWSSRKFKKQ